MAVPCSGCGRLLTTVTFDVWETLIHDESVNAGKRTLYRLSCLSEILGRAGYHFSREALAAADRQAMDACEEVWATLSEVPTRRQVELILMGLDHGLPLGLDGDLLLALDRAYVDCIFPYPPTLSSHAHEVLGELKGQGYRLGVVCNTGRTPGWALRQLFEGWGILRFFDDLIFSNEEDVRKPHPEIFLRELRRLGATPAEAVHIGDNPIADIGGAKALGMGAVMVGAGSPVALPRAPDAQVSDLSQVPGAVESLARVRP